MSNENRNIQTESQVLQTESSHVVIGVSAVPAGLTRYVTFVKVTQVQAGASGAATGKGSRVVFCSCAASGSASNITKASTFAKLSIGIASGAASQVPEKTVMIPRHPDVNNPLFSVAAGKWLTATLGSVAGTSSGVNIFVQFYDE